MGGLRGQEILIIVILLIIVFGWKKLPDAARSLGRSARVFKSEVEEMKKDGQDPGDGTVQSQAPEQPGPRPQVSPPAPTPQPESYRPEAFQPPAQPPVQAQRQDPPDDPTRPVA